MRAATYIEFDGEQQGLQKELKMKNEALTAAEMGAMGGKARAQSMTAQERSEQARAAVQARWNADLPRATHGSPDHPLKIGHVEIPCYVLEDGRRVLVQGGMMTGLDMSQGTAGRGPGDRLAKFIAGKAINPFVPKHLFALINNPIKFRTTSGSVAYGYEATVLADLCDAVLEARKTGKLNYQTEHIAERCEILVRGFARVGIVALVDEATGFQADRARDALAKILEAHIAKELRPWVRTFPLDYFKELCRLKGVEFSPTMKLPPYFGHLTNNIIYARLAPGVLEELKRRNPVVNGRRKNKHHSWLTEDRGHPKLMQHLGSVVTLMKLSKEWDGFVKHLEQFHPAWKHLPLYANLDDV
jgi:hypothetical protein